MKSLLLTALLLVSLTLSRADDKTKPVRVFILAGQSNMEGKAPNQLLNHQATDPKLPFVIAVMGQNGSKPATGAMLTIQTAQLAMNEVPTFKGTVKAFRTDVLVDKAAEELYPNWQKDVEKWKLVGGDHGYHYLGSAIWFTRIGHAMGDAMKELLGVP